MGKEIAKQINKAARNLVDNDRFWEAGKTIGKCKAFEIN